MICQQLVTPAGSCIFPRFRLSSLLKEHFIQSRISGWQTYDPGIQKGYLGALLWHFQSVKIESVKIRNVNGSRSAALLWPNAKCYVRICFCIVRFVTVKLCCDAVIIILSRRARHVGLRARLLANLHFAVFFLMKYAILSNFFHIL